MDSLKIVWNSLFTTILILNMNIVFGQDEEIETDTLQNEIHELDRKGGFQDIKLNTEVNIYEGLEYKKDIKEEKYPGAQLYVSKKGFYTNIGRVEIHSLEVKVYKNRIYEIIVIVDKDSAIYQGLASNFGEGRYNHREKGYYWKTNNVLLYFKSDKKYLILEYYSYIIERMRADEVKKSFTDVTDDF